MTSSPACRPIASSRWRPTCWFRSAAAIRAERFATALRVAALHAEPAIVAHYTTQLRATASDPSLVSAVLAGPASAGLPARLRAMLAHADLLVIRPAAATPADLEAL